jgi:hypothetical protein
MSHIAKWPFSITGNFAFSRNRSPSGFDPYSPEGQARRRRTDRPSFTAEGEMRRRQVPRASQPGRHPQSPGRCGLGHRSRVAGEQCRSSQRTRQHGTCVHRTSDISSNTACCRTRTCRSSENRTESSQNTISICLQARNRRPDLFLRILSCCYRPQKLRQIRVSAI